MKWEAVPADRLDAALTARWAELQRAAAAAGAVGLDSPYVGPGFTAAVAGVRPAVAVAVGHENGTPIAFLPFQRDADGGGEPAAGGASDAQALVAVAGFQCDPRELLRACGLPSWRFTYLPVEQDAFRPFHGELREVVSIDLAAGFAAWAARRRAAGSTLLKDLARRRRNLAREAGPLRFAADTRDPGVLARLAAWKSEQYRRSGLRDWTGEPWLRALLERLLAGGDPGLGATLGALWAGGRLAAAQLALRAGTVWHWWYTAYDPELARFSPGLLLDLDMLRAGEELGITRVDLGRAAPHKARLVDGGRLAARGVVPG